MNVVTYLSIALAVMYTDALCALMKPMRYHVAWSLLLSLAWPITCILAIFAAIKANATIEGD